MFQHLTEDHSGNGWLDGKSLHSPLEKNGTLVSHHRLDDFLRKAELPVIFPALPGRQRKPVLCPFNPLLCKRHRRHIRIRIHPVRSGQNSLEPVYP